MAGRPKKKKKLDDEFSDEVLSICPHPSSSFTIVHFIFVTAVGRVLFTHLRLCTCQVCFLGTVPPFVLPVVWACVYLPLLLFTLFHEYFRLSL
jgi:hypothetical protein